MNTITDEDLALIESVLGVRIINPDGYRFILTAPQIASLLSAARVLGEMQAQAARQAIESTEQQG